MLLNDFYKIESFVKEENQVDVIIKIDKSHDIFRGHFPELSVAPGVCVMQIVKELTEKATEKELFMKEANNIKFKALINPEVNEILNMRLILKEENDTIRVKNVTKIDDTVALTLSAIYREA